MQNIDVSQLTQQFPLLQSLIALEPVSWFNPKATTLVEGLPHVGLDGRDVADASARLARFAPICAKPSRDPRQQGYYRIRHRRHPGDAARPECPLRGQGER